MLELVLSLCAANGGVRFKALCCLATRLADHSVCLPLAFEALGLGSTYLGQVTQATTAVYCSVLAATFPFAYALCLAAAIRIGHLVGAGKAEAARMAARATCRLAIISAVVMACCLVSLRKYVAELYTEDSEVVRMFNENVSFTCFRGLLTWQCLHLKLP